MPKEPRPAQPGAAAGTCTTLDVRARDVPAPVGLVAGRHRHLVRRPRAARRSPSSDRPAPARRRWSSCWSVSISRSPGASSTTGTPAPTVDLDELRERIGFVTQDTQLFSGTIRENLLFVNPDRDRRRVPRRAAEGGVRQPARARGSTGLDTVIGEGGVKVSGGEKQRLSIARALLRRPHLLVFDEATSSLDSLTEEGIVRDDPRGGVTSQRRDHDPDRASAVDDPARGSHLRARARPHRRNGTARGTGRRRKGLYYAMWRQQIGERRPAPTAPAPAARQPSVAMA